MENEIKVGEYIRDKNGLIIKVNEIQDYSEDDDIWYEEEILKGTWKSMVVRHSPNLIDIIQCGDYVNGKEVKHIADFEGINKPIKKLIFVDEKHLIPGETAENEDIETIVTKEQMESITYKVTKM